MVKSQLRKQVRLKLLNLIGHLMWSRLWSLVRIFCLPCSTCTVRILCIEILSLRTFSLIKVGMPNWLTSAICVCLEITSALLSVGLMCTWLLKCIVGSMDSKLRSILVGFCSLKCWLEISSLTNRHQGGLASSSRLVNSLQALKNCTLRCVSWSTGCWNDIQLRGSPLKKH